MDVTFPVFNLEQFDKLLRSTEVAVDRAVTLPPVEVVAVRSKAGGFVMRRQRVGSGSEVVVGDLEP